MHEVEEIITCALCSAKTSPEGLVEALWLPPGAAALLESRYPGWNPVDGACSECVQAALMETLIAQGEVAHHNKIAAAWPLNAETAYGVLPAYMRLHVDQRLRGRGVTLALIDSDFYPHPDLVEPRNRIRAWVDATVEPVTPVYFGRDDTPEWPGWDSGSASQWHGMMTSGVAAGNGWLSHGLYRGVASEADVVLLKVCDREGHISSESICRALRWLDRHASELDVQVVNLSVAGDNVAWGAWNPVDEAVARLVSSGITVVAAAGNDGKRHLLPPATAPDAITVGGLDDKNNFDPREVEAWHSNYGSGVTGMSKPELVAPSMWVAAPLLPGSGVAEIAKDLFSMRYLRDMEIEKRIAEQRLVSPFYQYVEGTSFAAPIVSSFICCMLEANPSLTPGEIREILTGTARTIEGVSRERQGAGALVPCLALSRARRERGGPLVGFPTSPSISAAGVDFLLYDDKAAQVHVQGSWDNWNAPGVVAVQVAPGVWSAHIPLPREGKYRYAFVLDGAVRIEDPDNPHKLPNAMGDFDTVLQIPPPAEPIVTF